jgi:hypothetical protein
VKSVRVRPLRLAQPDDATDPVALSAVLGPVRDIERAPLKTVGYTAARHERLTVTLADGGRRWLVVKHYRLANDWTALRSHDRIGREAAMLAEPALDPIWDVFACPYVAFATRGDEVSLVMDDLTPHLFPDVREPLRPEQDEALLGALGALHATFESSPALDLPWLARPEHHVGFVDVYSTRDPAARVALPAALVEQITRGWTLALERVPPAVRPLIEVPASALAYLWEGLPRTLLHGDAKVANFARIADGRVAAFDWSLLAAGPLSIDLGWHLAVNATRLSRSKEETLEWYRELWTKARGAAMDDALWARLRRGAILFGGRLLLWSKAVALDADRPGAGAEWSWWMEHLEAEMQSVPRS